MGDFLERCFDTLSKHATDMFAEMFMFFWIGIMKGGKKP
jgi:hypothetical protein